MMNVEEFTGYRTRPMEEHVPDKQSQRVKPMLSIFEMAAAVSGLWLFAPTKGDRQTLSSPATQQLALQARTFVRHGHLSDALATLCRLVELDASNAMTYALIAWVLAVDGQLKRAFGYAQQTLKLARNNSDRAHAYYIQGIVYVRAGCWDAALAKLRDSLELISTLPTLLRPQVYFLLGHCHKAKGSRREAIHFLYQALQLDPLNSDTAAALGELYLATEDYHRAIAHYQRALRGVSDNQWLNLDLKKALLSTYYLHIGVAYSQIEAWPESWKHYYAAYQVCPVNPFALVNLAGLCARAKNVSQMCLYLKHVMPLLDDSAYFSGSQLVGVLLYDAEFEPYRDKVLRILASHNWDHQGRFLEASNAKQEDDSPREKMNRHYSRNSQVSVLNPEVVQSCQCRSKVH